MDYYKKVASLVGDERESELLCLADINISSLEITYGIRSDDDLEDLLKSTVAICEGAVGMDKENANIDRDDANIDEDNASIGRMNYVTYVSKVHPAQVSSVLRHMVKRNPGFFSSGPGKNEINDLWKIGKSRR